MTQQTSPIGPTPSQRVDSASTTFALSGTPAPMGASAVQSSTLAEWAAVLDSLESDLRNAEWLLSHGVGEAEVLAASWCAPENLGPLPAQYAQWVQSLLERQAQMYTRLLSATSRTRQRGTYFTSPGSRAQGAQSRFVDARA